jgi:hypothetical protein
MSMDCNYDFEKGAIENALDKQLATSFAISANNGVSKIENIVRHALLAKSMGVSSDDEIVEKLSFLTEGWFND